jgi:DNA-binding response OmpR family regulator
MGKILLVEPDMPLARIYAQTLQGRQHQTVVVATAQDAIVAADAAIPDLVLLELQLTTHGGVEFLYEFRSYADWRSVPIVIMSTIPPAEFDTTHAMLFEQLGVVRYHYKPKTSLAQLLRTVDGVLAKQAERQTASKSETVL